MNKYLLLVFSFAFAISVISVFAEPMPVPGIACWKLKDTKTIKFALISNDLSVVKDLAVNDKCLSLKKGDQITVKEVVSEGKYPIVYAQVGQGYMYVVLMP